MSKEDRDYEAQQRMHREHDERTVTRWILLAFALTFAGGAMMGFLICEGWF